MMGIVRLVIFGLVALTVFYWLVSIYSKSVRREKLEKQWDGDPQNEGNRAGREPFIEAGMQAYQGSLRRKLIVLVYIIPICVVGTTIYLINAQ